MYIHPGLDQRKPNKNLLDQWRKLSVDWVSVWIIIVGLIVIGVLVENKCANTTPDFTDPICVVVP